MPNPASRNRSLKMTVEQGKQPQSFLVTIENSTTEYVLYTARSDSVTITNYTDIMIAMMTEEIMYEIDEEIIRSLLSATTIEDITGISQKTKLEIAEKEKNPRVSLAYIPIQQNPKITIHTNKDSQEISIDEIKNCTPEEQRIIERILRTMYELG